MKPAAGTSRQGRQTPKYRAPWSTRTRLIIILLISRISWIENNSFPTKAILCTLRAGGTETYMRSASTNLCFWITGNINRIPALRNHGYTTVPVSRAGSTKWASTPASIAEHDSSLASAFKEEVWGLPPCFSPPTGEEVLQCSGRDSVAQRQTPSLSQSSGPRGSVHHRMCPAPGWRVLYLS